MWRWELRIVSLLLIYFTSNSDGQWYKKKIAAKELCVSKRFDLYLLLETSAFVGGGNMAYLKKYLKTIVDGIDVKHTHISIVTFDNKITERLSLKSGSVKLEVDDVISKLQPSGYGVSARQTMRYAADKLFTSEFGRRDDVPAVCLLFVAYPFVGDYLDAAKHLKTKCRLAIAGAKYARLIQMFQVASQPSTRHSVFSRRFKDLTRRTDSTLQVLCEPPLVSPRLSKEGFAAESIAIKWKAQPFASSFLLQLKKSSSLKVLREVSVPSSQSSFVFDKLPPRTNFQIHVWPVDAKGKNGPVGRMVAATGIKAPSLKVDNSSISDTSVTILMDRSIDANLKYFAVATSVEDDADQVSVLVSGSNVQLTGLEPGTKYNFKMNGYRMLRTSDTLEEVAPLLFSTAPSSPKVEAVSITKRSATIKWNIISSATHYKVIVNDVTDDVVTMYDDVIETGFLITNLQPSHTYLVHVVAYGNYGLESRMDNQIKIFTGPANPSDVSLLQVTENEVKLTWNDVEDTTEYWIFVIEGRGDDRKFMKKLTTISTTYQISGLNEGSWYTFVIYSTDEAQTIDQNIVYPLQVQTVPLPPSVFTANSTSSSITIGWEKPQGAHTYEVYMDGDYQDDVIDDDVTIEQLLPGEEYEFVVRTISESGKKSEMSEIFAFSTLPPASADVQATDIWTNGATIKWEPAMRAYGYKIVLLDADKNPEVVIMSRETEAKVTNLQAGTFYNVSIYTVGSENRINEHERATVLFQTVAEPPKFVQIREYGPTSLTVRWEHVNGAHGYRVSVTSDDASNDDVTSESYLVFGRNEETIFRLISVTQYRIVVYTINYFNKESHPSTVLIEYTLPETPDLPRVVEVATEMLQLDWPDVGGIERYVVHIENNETDKKWELSTAVSEVTIYDLTPGTWYDIHISSVGVTGRVNERGSRILSTQTLPATPANVRIRQYTTNTISVSWHKVQGARNYLLTVYDAISYDVMKRISVSGVYATVRNVEAGTEYQIEVSAVGQDYRRFGKPCEPLQVFTDPSPPDQPTPTFVMSTKIGLQWNVVKGARAYLVEIWSPTFSSELETNTNEIVIENLTPGFLYNFTIFSIGHIRSNNKPSPKLMLYTTPSPPENVRILNIKSKSAEIEWDSAEGARGYVVSVQGVNGNGRNGDIYVNNFTSTRAVVDQYLKPGTFYAIFVQTIGIAGPISEKKEFVEFMTLPANPGNPRLEKVRVYSVSVSWEVAEGASYYLLNLKRVEDELVDTIQSDIPSATLRGLQPGTSYQLHVQAFNTMDGASLNISHVLSFRTAPKGVEDFRIKSVTDTEIELQWSDTDGAEYYSLETSHKGKVVGTRKVEENEVVVDQLSPGQTYVFQILPVGLDGEIGSLSASVTETTIPNKPTPTIQDYGENFIRIAWDDIEGAATYKVVTESDSLVEARMTNTGTNTATITNLAPGSWHNFVIFSVDVKNRQSLTGSSPLSAMTSPRQVRNIEFEDISEHSFRITWSPSKGAAIYILEVMTSSSDETHHVETNLTSSTLMGLQSGSDYDVTIKMRDESGRVQDVGSKSSVSTLPEPVEMIEVETVGTNQVKLKWPQVRGATKYRLVTTVPEGVRTAETRGQNILLDGLIAGRFYEISAYSIGRSNIENPTPSPTLVVQTVPLPPNPPTFRDVTTTSFTVVWNSVFGASGYQLSATSSDGSEDIIVNDVISTSYTLESLTGGTEYVVHVVTNGQQEGRTSVPTSLATINTVCLTPEKPTVVEVTTSSVTLQWDPVKGAVGYDVEVADDEITIMTSAASTALVTIDSLSAGIRYNFTVYSIGKNQVRNNEGSIPVLVQIAPTAPEEVAFTQVGTTYVSMTWESVGLSSYDVRVLTLGDSVVQDLSNRRSPLLVTSLDPGEVYLFGVTSVGDGGYRSDESELVEQATLPVAVDSLTVKSVTSTTISASWTSTPGSQSYVLVAHSTVDEEIGTKIKTRQTNAVLRGLRAGHWYSLTVISIGKSSLTNQHATELTRVQTVSLPPGDVEIEQVTTTTIQLSWRQPHGVSFYELEVLALDDEFQTSNLKSLRAESDEIVIRNLLPGVSYMTRICSINEEGRKSDPTPKIYESTHPASATGLNVIDLNSTSVSINWTPVHGAHEYQIFSQDTITSDDTLLIRTAENIAHISDLSPGSKYKFIVFTYDSKNRSSNRGSDVLHVETVPLPPTSINVTDVTTTDLTLQWNEVKGAVVYKIRYGLNGDNEALQIINTTMTSLVISPLQSGYRYWFAIRSGGSENQLSESSHIVTQYTLPATPTSIEVEASSDYLTFYWNPVKGAIRYDGRLVAGEGKPLLASSQVPNITFQGLDVGRFYNFTVKSVGEERTNEEESDIFITQTAPGKPHGLVVIGTTTTSVQLDWDDMPGATSYLVIGQNTEGDLGEKEVLTSSANLAGLEPGTTYQFDVQALGYEDVPGLASDPITAVTIPSSPSIVSLDSIASDSVTMSWKPTKGAVSYVMMGTELNGRNSISVETSAVIKSNLTGLQPGTFYKFVVLARGVNGILNVEEGASIQRQTVPSPPASGHVSNITDKSMILRWEPSVGASSYMVRITSDENEVIYSSITEELEITDLLPGNEYQIYLQSVGEEGGISEEKYITSEITYPSAMKDIEAKFVSSTKVSLAWDAVTGATSYQVFVKSKDEVVSFDQLPGRIFVVEDTIVEVDELNPGTYYQFRVFSIGKKERRNEEDAAFIRVQTVTSSPTNLQASNVQTDSALFTWNKVQGAEKYVVYFELELSDVHNTSNIVDTIDNQVDLKNAFQPGQRYWVAVKAVNYQGLMSEGGEAIFITTQPEAVRNLTSYDVTNSSITLSWDRPIGAWNFEVQTRNMLNDEKSTSTTTSNSYIANNLQSGVNYQFYVTSIGMFDVRNSDKNSFVVTQVAPAAPTEVRVTSITNISIALQWKESFGASSYEVAWWLDDDVIESTRSEKTVESSFIVTSLTPGDEYTVTIQSYGEDDDVIHRHNNELKVQTRTDPPKFLQVFKITEDAIHTKWRASNGAQEYLVQVVSHEDNENIDIRKSPISKLVINNLVSGVKYDIFVRSVDMSGQASDRDAQLLDVQTVPSAPNSFITMEVTTNSITVAWNPSHGAVSYILKYGATNDKDDINMIKTSDIIATIDHLQAGVEYWMAVKSVGANDMIGRESEEIIETTIPATPSNFRVYDVTQEAVYLDWDTMKGSSGYILTVETIDNSTEVATSRTFETTVSRYQLNNLTPGEVYKANVKSVGQNGIVNHNASEELLIQTGIGAPTNLLTSSVSTSSFNISWDAVYGALIYEVRLIPHTDDSNIQIYETKQTNIQVDQLDSGTLYYVTVRGHGFNNAPGQISTKLEEVTLPLPPADLVVTHITTDSAFLMWTAQKGVTSYNIQLTAELNLYEATVINTKTPHFNVTGLLPGTEYLFVVYSIGTPSASHDGVNPKSSEVIERQTVCSPPSGLNISDVGASSMIISWTPSNGAAMYEVEMETEVQHPPDRFLLPETQVRLASLLPNTGYYFTVRAVNAENRSSDASERIHQKTLSSSAKNIQILDHNTTSATLSWEALEGVEGYRIVIVNIDEDEDLMFNVRDNHLVVDTLHPGTLYQITVFAVEHGEVLKEGSEPTTLLTIPVSPTNFQVDHVDSSTITLSWESAHGADHYAVKYSPTILPEEENTQFAFSNKLTISQLESGREYKFQISTVGRLNDPSEVATELIETTDPLSPEMVSSEELGEDFVVLDWQVQQGAFGYSISYKHDETVEEVFAENPPYTLSPLDDMTSYEIVVRSVGVRGVVPEGSQVLRIHTDLLTPKNVRVTSVGTNSVRLDWDDFKDSTGYKLYYQTNGYAEDVIETSVSEHLIDENLNPGTIYHFSVTSVDINGRETAPSETVRMTTMVHPPDMLKLVKVGSKSATISWDHVTGATSYRVQVTDDDDDVIMDEHVDDVTVVVDELSPGSKYHVRAASRDKLERQSPKWSEVLALNTIPAKPSGLNAVQISTSSLTFRWNKAQGASKYEIEVHTDSEGRKNMESENNFYQINNLQPGEEVSIKIISKSADQVRNEEAINYTRHTILPAPSGLSATTLNYTSILLSWNPLERAQSYTLYISGEDSSSPKKSLSQSLWKINDITTTRYEVGNLKAATLYNFQLSAHNYDGAEGMLSSSISAITGAIELISQGHNWLLIRWPQSQFAITYTITYTWKDESNEMKETILEKETTDFMQRDGAVYGNVTNLFPDTEYSFKIRSRGRHLGEETELKEFTAETLQLVPPSNIRVVELRANHVIVSWDVYQYATSYDVKLVHKITQDVRFQKNVEGNTVLIDGLRTLEVYMLTVRSVAHGGRSINSEPPLPIQPRHPTPVLPQGVAPELISRSPSSLVVKLEPAEFAASYQLQLYDDSANLLQTKLIPRTDVGDSVVIGSLKDNFFYKISYSATGFGGDISNRSPFLNTSTTRRMPQAPQNVKLLSKRAGYVVISFDWSKYSTSHSVTVINRYKGTVLKYRNVTSPYRITSLTVGDAYLIKVNAHSKYGDVIPSDVLSVEIPYPTGGKVRLSRPTRVTSSGFRIQWSPTPYTSSYKLTLTIGSNPMLEVRNVASNQYDFVDLRPSTTYWVKVEAIGRNGVVMSKSSFVRARTGAEFTKSNRGSLVTRRGDEDEVYLDDELFLQLLQAILDTTDSNEEASVSELNRYRGELEKKILQLHEIYNYSADSSDYNRPLDIMKLNDLGKKLKPMVNGEVVKPLTELDTIGREISEIFMEITELDEVLTDDEMETFNIKLRDILRQILAIKGITYIDASEGFGKNRDFAMSFSLVSSHGFRVSWLRFRNSHRYLVILVEQDHDVIMVHNKTYLGLSASFDNLTPDSAYNVTVIPLSANGLLMNEFSTSSIVVTKSQNHKLLAEISSIGNRHIIVSWKVWPTELSGVTFTLTSDGALSQRRVVTRRASHRVIMFVGLASDTQYQIVAVSTDGEVVYEGKATTKSSTSSIQRAKNDEAKTRVMLPPTNIEVLSSAGQQVTISWNPPSIEGVPPEDISYSVGLYRPGRLLLVKLIRRTRQTHVVFTDVEIGEYDVRIRSHNDRSSGGKQSPYSSPIRVVIY